MANIITKLIGDKAEWKALEARAGALPRDYIVTYDEIKSYMWKLATGDGMSTVAALESVIALFEEGAADDRSVREVTGPDIAAFCDARLAAHGAASYVDTWRASLNAAVDKKLAG